MLAAASCAAILAACGGGGDDSTATTATDSTAAEAPSNPVGGNKEKGTSGGGQAGSGKNGSSQKGGSGSGKPGGSGGGGSGGGDDSAGVAGGSFKFTGEPTKHDHPAPVEGKRSDGFVTPGGDNSIQEYGEEGDSDERAAAMVPISAVYRALFSGDWNEVCDTYLSAGNLEQIKLLAEKSPQMKGKDCAAVLGGLTQSTGMKGPDTPDGGVVSLRVEGDTGFAIYWGIDGKGYAFALKSEGGSWKLTSIAPTPLQF